MYLAIFLLATAAPTTAQTLGLKVLAIAVAIYPILQMIKKFFPQISGPYALAVNISLAVVGLVVTVPANQLLTLPTLLALITAASAAAGIHGTVQNLAPTPQAPAVTVQPAQAPAAQGQ